MVISNLYGVVTHTGADVEKAGCPHCVVGRWLVAGL